MSPAEQPKSDADQASWRKSPFAWAFVIGLFVVTGLGALRPLQERYLMRAPPPLMEIEPWQLTSQRGESFGSEQLRGKVWVADFFFTRCPSICPELTRKMHEVQESFRKYGDDVHLVSFTVDPTHDTPEQLRAYMEKHDADPSRWTFVTGSRDEVVDVVMGKMKLLVGEREPLDANASDAQASGAGLSDDDAQDALYEISHTGKFVLFDQNGDVRAYFSSDREGLGALGNAARLLVQKGP